MPTLPMANLASVIAPVLEAIGNGLRWVLSRDDRTVDSLTGWRDALRRMNDRATALRSLVDEIDPDEEPFPFSEEPIEDVRAFKTAPLRDIAGALRYVAMGLRQNTAHEQGLSGFAVLRATNSALMTEVDRELQRSAALAEDLDERAEDWGDAADAIDALAESGGHFVPHEEAMRSVGLRS